MSKRTPEKKLPMDGVPPPLANPFAALNLSGLPAGPAAPESGPVAKTEKQSAHGRVVLRRETSQRGGKTVVVVGGFDPSISLTTLEELAREARKKCGCGGTVRDREIEIQGDQPARVADFFRQSGFRVAGVVE